MIQKLLKKDKISKFISAVTNADYSIYGPVKLANQVSLTRVSGEDEIIFDYAFFKLPAKNHFFPRSELFFSYESGSINETNPQNKKTILFGLRSCDAMSLLYLDKVFADDKYPDPYYKNWRETTLIITIACKEPLTTCFCTSVGGSPSSKKGSDIIIFEVEDSLLLESCSEKGEVFLKPFLNFFEKPSKEDIDYAKKQTYAAEKKVNKIDIAGISNKLKDKFYDSVWDELALRCLGCGVCTYLCPTCYCFGLYDEKTGSKIKRIRVQDSCMYPSFTLEASGHNPRKNTNDRMRQRLMHKFHYTSLNFEDTFCVGCGRCIKYCPVNMDIRENILEVIS